MNAYMDASVLLRLLLGEQGQLSEWRQFEKMVSSSLVEVECMRVLDRLRLQSDLPEKEVLIRREALFSILEAVEVVELTPPLLRRASDAFPVMIGTLDAIHLVTALAWKDEYASPLCMATHDKALGQAARAFGLQTIGV